MKEINLEEGQHSDSRKQSQSNQTFENICEIGKSIFEHRPTTPIIAPNPPNLLFSSVSHPKVELRADFGPVIIATFLSVSVSLSIDHRKCTSCKEKGEKKEKKSILGARAT